MPDAHPEPTLAEIGVQFAAAYTLADGGDKYASTQAMLATLVMVCRHYKHHDIADMWEFIPKRWSDDQVGDDDHG